MKINCDDKDWNPYYFFQPASPKESVEVTLKNQSDPLPNPMDKHRVPTPRLVPSGFNRG